MRVIKKKHKRRLLAESGVQIQNAHLAGDQVMRPKMMFMELNPTSTNFIWTQIHFYALKGCTSRVVKSVRSRCSFISSPVWTS